MALEGVSLFKLPVVSLDPDPAKWPYAKLNCSCAVVSVLGSLSNTSVNYDC